MLQIKHKQPDGRAQALTGQSYDFGQSDKALYKVGVLPLEARIVSRANTLYLYNVGRSGHVLIDGQPVTSEIPLRSGMVLSIGGDDFDLLDISDVASEKPLLAGGTGWSLIALNTAVASQIFPLTQTQSVGRADYCDICLNVAHLSRRHAQIKIENGYLQVTDLNSSNGTYLNGKRIRSAHVIDGDEIQFDTLSFKVIGPVPEFQVDKTTLRTEKTFKADKTVIRPMAQHVPNVTRKPESRIENEAPPEPEVFANTSLDEPVSATPVVKKTKIMQQSYASQEVYNANANPQSQDSTGLGVYILVGLAVTALVVICAIIYIML